MVVVAVWVVAMAAIVVDRAEKEAVGSEDLPQLPGRTRIRRRDRHHVSLVLVAGETGTAERTTPTVLHGQGYGQLGYGGRRFVR